MALVTAAVCLQVAAQYGLPAFFHGRYSTDVPPNNNAKTLSEILDLARQTSSGVHVMHITSTGGTFQMQERAYYRPRMTASVARTGC